MSRKTYEVGHRRRRNWRLAILAMLALVLLTAGVYIYRQFEKDTQTVIRNTPGTTHELVIPNSQKQRFDENTFTFEAPADWKLVKHDTAPYNLFSYRSTLTNADNRSLDIYMDTIPQKLAVNKAVAVRAQENMLSHGLTSDNCMTFTAGTSSDAHIIKPLSFVAKWDGVEFICDNDNTLRNVIGTSAAASVNKVTMTGSSGNSHSFFYVYTDNNATPDYTIFYNMLDSFTLK